MRAPKGLGSAGRALWKSIEGSGNWELRPDEIRMLEDACREADLVARLDDALRDADLLVKGSMGQVVANPLVQELRQHRNTLSALLVKLKLENLPDDEDDTAGDDAPIIRMSRSEVARNAANVRWAKHG